MPSKYDEVTEALEDCYHGICSHYHFKQALTHLQELKEAVHKDLPMVLETARKTGWDHESDLSIITTQSAKALNDFMEEQE